MASASVDAGGAATASPDSATEGNNAEETTGEADCLLLVRLLGFFFFSSFSRPPSATGAERVARAALTMPSAARRMREASTDAGFESAAAAWTARSAPRVASSADRLWREAPEVSAIAGRQAKQSAVSCAIR